MVLYGIYIWGWDYLFCYNIKIYDYILGGDKNFKYPILNNSYAYCSYGDLSIIAIAVYAIF